MNPTTLRLTVVDDHAALIETFSIALWARGFRVRNVVPAAPTADFSQLGSALVDEWRATVASTRNVRDRLAQVTPREAGVLRLLMVRKQVMNIARLRFVSECTVRAQVKSVLAKLQVNSQLTAFGMASQSGWCPPTQPLRQVAR